jgi:hypothetical protein
MPARNYRDLIAWEKAFELTLAVYAETKCFPIEPDLTGLTEKPRHGSQKY